MKPQLFRIITLCNFFLLTWKGLLHFTSGINYSPLFETGENMTLLFGLFLMVVGMISLFPMSYLRIGRLKSLYFISTVILLLNALNEMMASQGTIEQLLRHSFEVLLPFAVFLHLTNEQKKRNWKEIFYFGLFFTLTGQGLVAIGLSGENAEFQKSIVNLFGSEHNLGQQLSAIFGGITIGMTLLLFIAQTRVFAFWYVLFYGMFLSSGSLISSDFDMDDFTFYTVDVSNILSQLPMIILPFYFLARTHQWKWALPTRGYFVRA